MHTFTELKKNLKRDFSNLRPVKVALLGDTATQLLAQALRGSAFNSGLDLQTWEADFNQVQRQVFDLNSELYEWHPTIIIIFQSSHKLLGKYNQMSVDDNRTLAVSRLNEIESLYKAIKSRLAAKIIYFNYPEINDAVFGSYASKTEASFLYQQRKLNYLLMEFATKTSGLYIADLSDVQNQLSKATMFQPAIYVNSDMVLSIDALPIVAAKTVDIIAALSGTFKKCVILDLDNTLWGGTIGDDGLENIELGSLGIGKAFTEFQYWLKKLKNRGILLAVCSKNTESIAKEPFENHPDMVLRLDDISVFVANWENKVDNIRYIQSVLNIGFDSMVFLDDNPFERNMVKENIPELTIPELPLDPAEYLEYLYGLNLFETASFSTADTQRTTQYQANLVRASLKEDFKTEEDFLKSLAMESLVEPFNKFNTPRVAQLAQRSNQFNLRTVRYTEQEVEKLSQSPDYFTFAFTLKDKFGDNGLICIIVLKKQTADTLFVETWLMSCRVLKRGMELFVLNTIADFSKAAGYSFLKGEYLLTTKNDLVKDHYQRLGFIAQQDSWLLNIGNYKHRSTFITKT